MLCEARQTLTVLIVAFGKITEGQHAVRYVLMYIFSSNDYYFIVC